MDMLTNGGKKTRKNKKKLIAISFTFFDCVVLISIILSLAVSHVHFKDSSIIVISAVNTNCFLGLFYPFKQVFWFAQRWLTPLTKLFLYSLL